jgi:hypothetical protein
LPSLRKLAINKPGWNGKDKAQKTIELFVKHVFRVNSYDARFSEFIIKIKQEKVNSPTELLKAKQ